jgi:hypothetical protein
MSFDKLKKASFEDLNKELEKMNKGGSESYKDDRMWKPTRDKSGNGYAIIRFLPQSEGENIPWVKTYSHAFKGPTGKWFIENCPTTIGRKCPLNIQGA